MVFSDFSLWTSYWGSPMPIHEIPWLASGRCQEILTKLGHRYRRQMVYRTMDWRRGLFNIAIDWPINSMLIFHSYVNVYQRLMTMIQAETGFGEIQFPSPSDLNCCPTGTSQGLHVTLGGKSPWPKNGWEIHGKISGTVLENFQRNPRFSGGLANAKIITGAWILQQAILD